MSRLERLMALLDTDPTDAELPYMIAHEHANTGDHEAATTWFDRCIALDADHLYAYYHKARSLESLDRMDDARDTLRAGLERARAARDAKAEGELEGFLSQLADLV